MRPFPEEAGSSKSCSDVETLEQEYTERYETYKKLAE